MNPEHLGSDGQPCFAYSAELHPARLPRAAPTAKSSTCADWSGAPVTMAARPADYPGRLTGRFAISVSPSRNSAWSSKLAAVAAEKELPRKHLLRDVGLERALEYRLQIALQRLNIFVPVGIPSSVSGSLYAGVGVVPEVYLMRLTFDRSRNPVEELPVGLGVS